MAILCIEVLSLIMCVILCVQTRVVEGRRAVWESYTVMIQRRHMVLEVLEKAKVEGQQSHISLNFNHPKKTIDVKV